MEATDVLMEEHRVIERVLGSLERAARALESGERVPAAHFLDAADFVAGFADGCHHRKEEGALFPALEAAGVANRDGPIGAMLADHDAGRRLIRAMRAAAEGLAAGDQEQTGAVVKNAVACSYLLRQHIAKEDTVLFPLAERVLAPDAQAELNAAFERVEHEETGEGVHEKYLALADRLTAAGSE